MEAREPSPSFSAGWRPEKPEHPHLHLLQDGGQRTQSIFCRIEVRRPLFFNQDAGQIAHRTSLPSFQAGWRPVGTSFKQDGGQTAHRASLTFIFCRMAARRPRASAMVSSLAPAARTLALRPGEARSLAWGPFSCVNSLAVHAGQHGGQLGRRQARDAAIGEAGQQQLMQGLDI